MEERLGQKNSITFDLVLANSSAEKKQVTYELQDNPVADLWIKAMKHLKNVEPHPFDSHRKEPRDLDISYPLYCDFAGIEPIDIGHIDRKVLNGLHRQYMDNADRLSRIQDCEIMYEFHQAIHRVERKMSGTPMHEDQMHEITYSRASAPLHKRFPCNQFYADRIIKNNIYLRFAESGKRPSECWDDKETATKENLDKTMVAHYTFKPDWFISLKSYHPSPLPKQFDDWFYPFRQDFLDRFGLSKWDHVDEQSAVHLASPTDTTDVASLIRQGYLYQGLVLNS
jgi:hypothetical protein